MVVRRDRARHHPNVSVALTPQLRDDLQVIADREQNHLSSVLRRFLALGVENYKKGLRRRERADG
jgi:hypothetical protein